VGKDAGEICGLGRALGVTATDTIEDILAQKPECVLYMPQSPDVDDLCKLLAAGCNVVTTVASFHDPEELEAGLRARIAAACQSGGTSLHSTGSSPGFISATLPYALTSLLRRLDCYTIDEYADMSSRNSPAMIFDGMGFGKAPAAMNQRNIDHFRHSFSHSLLHLAKTLAMPLDRIEASGEFGTARNRVTIAAGVLEPGTVAAQRYLVEGFRGEQAVMRFRANWYCTTDIEQPDWDLGDTGWRVRVEGDPPLDIRIGFPCSPEDWPNTSPGLTAYPAVNAIPAVCAAEPGIRTAADLKVFSVLGEG
jgi:4-hydroxy-tetrahydrodipicolinate reductase